MVEISELMVSTAIEPFKGISELGLETIRKSGGSSDFLTPGVTVSIVALAALVIGSAFLTHKGFFNHLLKSSK